MRLWLKRNLGVLIVGCVVLILIAGILLPASQDRPPPPELRDSTQLKQVHLGALIYLDYHDVDVLPTSWWVLIEHENIVPELLVSAKHGSESGSRKVDALKAAIVPVT